MPAFRPSESGRNGGVRGVLDHRGALTIGRRSGAHAPERSAKANDRVRPQAGPVAGSPAEGETVPFKGPRCLPQQTTHTPVQGEGASSDPIDAVARSGIRPKLTRTTFAKARDACYGNSIRFSTIRSPYLMRNC